MSSRGIANHLLKFLVLLGGIVNYASVFNRDLQLQATILDFGDEVVEVSGKNKRSRKSKQHNWLIELEEEEFEDPPPSNSPTYTQVGHKKLYHYNSDKIITIESTNM